MKTQSDTIGKIVEALTKAQIQFEPIIKDVKAHLNKFAPLPACLNSTRKALFDNGLCVSQTMNVLDDGRSIIETTLGHISGEFFKSYSDLTQLLINGKGPNPLHTWGSIITYTRRYTYLAIIGACSEDEDNDGADIQSHKSDTHKNRNQITQADPLITQLTNLIKSSGCDIGEFTKYHGISSKDTENVKLAIGNFDQLLIMFRESNRVINEKQTKI